MWTGLKIERNSVNVSIRDFCRSDLDDLLRLLPVCNAEEFKASGFDPDHVRSMVNRLYGVGRQVFVEADGVVREEAVQVFCCGS